MCAAQLVSDEKDFPISQVGETLHALDEGRLAGRGVLVPAAS